MRARAHKLWTGVREQPAVAAFAVWALYVLGVASLHRLRVSRSAAFLFGHSKDQFRYERLVEYGHVLGYGASAVVSYFAAQEWLPLLDALAALAWLLPELPRFGPWLCKRGLPPARWRQPIDFFNRHAGHIAAAFLSTIVLAAGLSRWPPLQLILVPACLTVVPFALERTLDHLLHQPGRGGAADFFWARRIVYYVVILVGLLFLVVLAPNLVGELARAAGMLVLGTTFRIVRWVIHYRAYRAAVRAAAPGVHVRHQDAIDDATDRKKRRVWDRVVVLGAIGLSFAPAFVLVTESAERTDNEARQRHWMTCADSLPAPPAGPAPIALFLVADNQFHELRGERAGSHLDLVDSFVPVAVRPVELDLLSGATLGHFGKSFEKLRSQPGMAGLKWAHLGDSGDLACSAELDRFAEVVANEWPKGSLLALTPGNHDSTFVGNFHWHPSWESACVPLGEDPPHQTHHLGKEESDRKLLALATAAGAASPNLIEHQLSALTRDRTALWSVVALGKLDGRPLLGAFVDTSDFTFLDVGVAGARGSISLRQILKLRRAIAKVPGRPLVIAFIHHPLDEMSLRGRGLLRLLTAENNGAELLALVSAHTHLAALRDHRCSGIGVAPGVPELVIGSVTDPPQEAALLEVWPKDGSAFLRLRAMPAVAREGLTCSLLPAGHSAETAAGLRGSDCADLLAALQDDPACAPLFQELHVARRGEPPPHVPEPPGGVSCAEWAKKRAEGLGFTSEPDDVLCDQQDRAERLSSCLCRDGQCGTLPPLDPRTYDALFHQQQGKRDELVCLSWAASILQDKKHAGWPLSRALAYSTEESVAYGPLEMAIDLSSKPACDGDAAAALYSTVPP